MELDCFAGWPSCPNQFFERVVEMTQNQAAIHDNVSGNYYHFVRKEIAPLLPRNPSTILDVGAASGATIKWLKTIFPNIEATGVELNQDMREELCRNADECVIGKIEECISQLKSYDLILLLDVLEHMNDSLSTLKQLRALLNPHGTMIVSLPNVAHLSVSVPLLLRRKFEYQDAGILDRTHLRFFTEYSAVKLLNDAGLTVKEGLMSGLDGPKSRLIDRVSLGLLRHHLTKQYIISAELANGSQQQNRVKWMPNPTKPPGHNGMMPPGIPE
jgi:2-polyprenyl-3-methyl-5-hydroxy-6-metoxy-1,4-benzoquinol methylase